MNFLETDENQKPNFDSPTKIEPICEYPCYVGDFKRKMLKKLLLLRFPPYYVFARLLASGHSMEEIVTCALQANQVKHSRMESIRNMKWDGFHHAIETTTRTLKKVARRSSLLASVPLRRRASMLQGLSTPKKDPVARRHSMLGSVCDADANVSLARSA
jgi:hypothetical protein